jgi:hypothetical protein
MPVFAFALVAASVCYFFVLHLLGAGRPKSAHRLGQVHPWVQNLRNALT